MEPTLLFVVEAEIRAQFRERFWTAFARLRTPKHVHRSLRISRRAQKMSCFEETAQLIGAINATSCLRADE